MRRRYLALSLLSLAAWSSPAQAARSLSVSPGKLTTGGTFVVSSTREPRDETECNVTVTRPSGGTSTVSCQGGTGVATEPGIWRFSLVVYVSTKEAKDGYVTLTTSLNVTPPAAASATATTAPPLSTPTTTATAPATAAGGTKTPTAVSPTATAPTGAKAAPARSGPSKAPVPTGDAGKAGAAGDAAKAGAAGNAASGLDPVVLGIGLGVLLLVLVGLGVGLRAYSKSKARAQAAAPPPVTPPPEVSPAGDPASAGSPPLATPPAPPPAGVKPKLEPKLVLGPLKSHPIPGTPPFGPEIAGPEWSFMVRLPPPVITSTPIAEGENTETV